MSETAQRQLMHHLTNLFSETVMSKHVNVMIVLVTFQSFCSSKVIFLQVVVRNWLLKCLHLLTLSSFQRANPLS